MIKGLSIVTKGFFIQTYINNIYMYFKNLFNKKKFIFNFNINYFFISFLL